MTKFTIGCGKRNFGPDWVHVDGADYPHITMNDIYLLNIESNTADLIYASHFIEYMDRQEVVPLLKCWHRVLKTGGIVRVAVPDFDAMVQAYLYMGFDLSDILGPMYGRMFLGKELIYHKTVYNKKHLTAVLEEAGFKDARIYDWEKTEHSQFDDCSRAHLPHDLPAIQSGKFDPEKHLLISLNMEATK